ncbi:RNA polymerase sigma factor [Conexibacter sp. SYSU D00693]|uniref:RNA polymerase sigma factor n=1 Tax=Conexibacter sp. SYSU D00693 TaxID=2812560 RepID=UPI00196A72F3|nr:sigma-70 family RNA polymerase sigma factor [Conexibacter sp. SYSU D00693]
MERSDAQLLAGTAAGDPDAFAAFFRRHEQTVTAFVLRRCAGPDEVADAVADTFLAALRGAGRFRDEHPDGGARPWLLGIAVRVVLRQRRGARRRLRLGARAAGAQPRYAGAEADAIAAAVDAARRRPELEAALDALPRREREVLELVVHDELTPTEVAAALGISANAARLRLSRARARLRAALGDDTAPDPDPTTEAAHAR